MNGVSSRSIHTACLSCRCPAGDFSWGLFGGRPYLNQMVPNTQLRRALQVREQGNRAPEVLGQRQICIPLRRTCQMERLREWLLGFTLPS